MEISDCFFAIRGAYSYEEFISKNISEYNLAIKNAVSIYLKIQCVQSVFKYLIILTITF